MEKAVENGVVAVALTNINGTADVWDFVKLCRDDKINPIVGTEIRNWGKLSYTLIVANYRGYAWINRFLSGHLISEKDFLEPSEDLHFFENWWDRLGIFTYGMMLHKPYLQLLFD